MTAVVSVLNEETELRSVVGRVIRNSKPTLSVNFRHAGMRLPWTLSEKGDLYAAAPQEIRDLNSLHFVADQSFDELWELSEQLRERDACIWVFSSLKADALLKGLKLFLAWYSRPSVLKTQFEQGSKELAKRLLTGVTAALVQVPGDPIAYVFVNSDISESLNLSELSSNDQIRVSVV